MLEQLKNQSNVTYTENGAVAYSTTGSACLDLFASIGAMRNGTDADIIARFVRAYTENPLVAMKILFFTRDVRGGLGERRVFRVILKWLANNEKSAVLKNMSYISEYGRYDDLLVLLDTKCSVEAVKLIKKQLEQDVEMMERNREVSLLAKWLPSANASNKETIYQAKKLIRMLCMKECEYRKVLSSLRSYIKIIENNLRTLDYTFSYSNIPSKAMFKYRSAFYRNDKERYSQFLVDVKNGKAKLNASTLMPYELIAPYIDYRNYYKFGSYMRDISESEKQSLNVTWNSLPDFCNDENALAIVDTSGSMHMNLCPTPASVALSLGLYFAERSKGVFKNHFIEFSEKPKLIEVKGETFVDKLRYISTFTRCENTDIEAVFNLILNTALRYNVPQKELPSKLYIISDMQFDSCAYNSELSNFENAKQQFEKFGYELPQIVFWNVADSKQSLPVTKNEQGVALVSGCSPRLFSMVMSGELSPYNYMMGVIKSERYIKIKV